MPSPLAPEVLFLDHCARDSGAELALWRITAALHRYAPRVVLGEEGPLTARLAAQGVPVQVLPLAPAARDFSRDDVGALSSLRQVRHVLAQAWVLRRLLHRERPALVHTNSMKAHVYGALAAWGSGVPLVVHVHDRLSTDHMSRGGVLLIRWLLRLVPAAVVANSEATLATVPASVRRRKSVLVLPCPVVPPPVPGQPSDDGPLTFGIVGRIAPWKGQDLVIRAFADAFPAGGPRHRLRIVGAPQFGETGYLDQLHELAEELGVGDRVDFAGHVPDVFVELARVHVLVHGSLIPEPFGQVVVEGMAAELAVVAADEGGPREIVEPGCTGLLYPARDAGALADCLRMLAHMPALRRSLGAAAVEAARRYEPAQVVPRLEEFYDRCIGAAAPVTAPPQLRPVHG